MGNDTMLPKSSEQAFQLQSALPYVAAGVAGMTCLALFALFVLAWTILKRASIVRDPEVEMMVVTSAERGQVFRSLPSFGRRSPHAQMTTAPGTPDELQSTDCKSHPSDKLVVIMAGESEPTHLAQPKP